jgi:1,6-anhydro-N-acetylmuramate kinase
MIPPELALDQYKILTTASAKTRAIALAHENAPVAADLAAVQAEYASVLAAIDAATSTVQVEAAIVAWLEWEVPSEVPSEVPPEFVPPIAG